MSLRSGCLLFVFVIVFAAFSMGDIQTGEWLGPWVLMGPYSSTDSINRLNIDWLNQFGGETQFAQPGFEIKSQVFSLTVSPMSTGYQKGYVDIEKSFRNRQQSVIYAVCDITSDKEQVGLLRFGTDDGYQLWVNGKVIAQRRILRGAAKDSDSAIVPLHKGINRLMFKIDQGDQGWGLYARFERLWLVKPGKSLVSTGEIFLPDLLVGSRQPLQQTLDVEFLNRGTDTIDQGTVSLKSNALADKSPVIVNGLKPADCTTLRFILKPLSTLTAGKTDSVEILSEFGGTFSFLLYQGKLEIRKAHPLLTGELDSADSVFRFIHLTDTHIVTDTTVIRNVRTADNLKMAVRQINHLSPLPDFIVMTGDVLLEKEIGFTVFRKIMSELKIPYVCAYGNHDHPRGIGYSVKVFSEWGYPPYYSFDFRGKHFIILNTTEEKDQYPRGYVSPFQQQWLSGDLKNNPAPQTFVFTHQDLITKLGATNGQDIEKILSGTPGQKWVFSGHLHCDLFANDTIGNHHILTNAVSYLFPELSPPDSLSLPGFRQVIVQNNDIRTQFIPLGGVPIDDPLPAKYLKFEEVQKLWPVK